MAVSLIKYAFVAGELSPQGSGRTDLEKYDLALERGLNWFVDYLGGISTRPGTELVDRVENDEEETRFVEFRYAPDVEDTYVVLFGDGYIRFIQDGAYVIEDTRAVAIGAITQANPGVVTTLIAHNIVVGDVVILTDVGGMEQINNRLLLVTAVGVDTVTLGRLEGGNFSTLSFDAYTSGGTINPVYTIDSPYAPEHLAALQAKQKRDYVRLTHNQYPVYNLIRHDHTDWEIVEEDIGNAVTRPSGLTGGGSTAGNAQVGFVVTSVFEDGTESIASDMLIISSIVNYSATAGHAAIRWNAVTDARYYNVYRTLISPGTFTQGGSTVGGVTKGDQVGFVGRAYAPRFMDPNITPDFTLSPPQRRNPFANRAIETIEITDAGTGYAKDTTTVSVTGAPGSGFAGQAVVNDAGAIIGVIILNAGEGYVNPVVSFGGAGSGATATATTSPASGNYPAISAVFQSRQWYGASLNDPLGVFASKPGRLSNMDESVTGAANDAIEAEVDSEEVAPLLHMIDMRGGMMLMSQSGVWLLRAASAIGAAITPEDIVADPQSARGASYVRPIVIDTDVLYVEGKNPTVRLLSYSDLAKSFVGQDMSILSSHLFKADNRILRMAHAQNPHNVVWAIREDGRLLAFTLVREQDVYAWTPCETNGFVKDICVVHENGRDSVYLMVLRFVNDRWTKFIERMAPREFETVEDAWCVDCGLETASDFPDAEIVVAAGEAGDTVVLTADAAIFTSADEGKVLRAGGGKALVTNFDGTDQLTVQILVPFTDLMPQGTEPRPYASGEWTLNEVFNTVSGLWHLEGRTVSILADGMPCPPQQVVNGEVAIGQDASLVRVGLPYTCVARTLAPTAGENIIEAKLKSVVGSYIRVHDTVGLKTGSTLDNLYPIKERTDEPYGIATRLQSGYQHALIESHFDDGGQTYYVQDQPLPATVIGLVTEMEIGDNDDND